MLVTNDVKFLLTTLTVVCSHFWVVWTPLTGDRIPPLLIWVHSTQQDSSTDAFVKGSLAHLCSEFVELHKTKCWNESIKWLDLTRVTYQVWRHELIQPKISHIGEGSQPESIYNSFFQTALRTFGPPRHIQLLWGDAGFSPGFQASGFWRP